MGALKKRYQEMVAAADRLSHREKIMVAGVAIVFVIFVGTLVSMWVSSKLSNIERRVSTKTKSLQTMIDMDCQQRHNAYFAALFARLGQLGQRV